ncbi:DsbA family protein [Vibrio rumoiensis]|uniref:Disulfide bond formation protein DsbA n=1 Tax=Vibrio rumoiensis 1S-45 TaxID=1188252 RepID=A0A1E5DZ91_9VIBR|nr:DsbA family protein [Vibrio rumoiensis]OEF23228.1 disulfide bond formation protein DsbA [Vibrio rumoiensis 1S-45]
MKKLILPLALTLGAHSAFAADTTFTPEQEAKIGEIAAQYLVDNPEFLIKASQKLQQQQLDQQANVQKSAVLANQDALLNDKTTPFTGPKTAKVNVIEFFDYQCVYCFKISPTIEKLQKEYPNVRFIFKETPIFGSRWEPSKYAAQMGLEVFAQKGSNAYNQYHNGIYASGLNEGKLTKDVVDSTATSAGIDIKKFKPTENYQKNLQLFSQLGFKGTPALVVMPTNGATVDNTYIINGADVPTLTNALKILTK